MIDQGKVLRFLDSLGNDAIIVADSLEQKRCGGFKGDSMSCPMANALKRNFNQDLLNQKYWFTVNPQHIEVRWEDGYFNIHPPIPIEEFVRGFDAGEFDYISWERFIPEERIPDSYPMEKR